jgi:hypothetical protein
VNLLVFVQNNKRCTVQGIKIILCVHLSCLPIHSKCSTLWAGLYHKNFPINLREPDNWGTWLLLHHSLLLHIPITLHQFRLFRSNSNTNIPHIYPIRFSPFLLHKSYSHNHVCYSLFQASQFSVDGFDDRRIDSIPGRSRTFPSTVDPTRWLRNRATSWKVASSIPDGVIGIFHCHNPSGSTMTLDLTQPLSQKSTRNIFWSKKTASA